MQKTWLLEYSKDYRELTGTLWNYYRDELGLLILTLLNTIQLLKEILIILLMVMMLMTEVK